MKRAAFYVAGAVCSVGALVLGVYLWGAIFRFAAAPAPFDPVEARPLQRTMLDAKYPIMRMGLTAICDPHTGNLIYLYREGRETSMAVVPGGCTAVVDTLRAEEE